MALRIEAEAERLAREIAHHTGETPAQAVITALRERLGRLEDHHPAGERRVDELMAIIERSAGLPVLDPRQPDEIIGYDEHGLPR
jgi:antitoxin VapB